MSEKRYFNVEYDEEWYLFDANTISEELVKEQAEYGYGVFANSLSPSEICELLNKLNDENEQLRENLHNCRLNKSIIREKLKLWQEVHKEYNIYSIKDFEELLNELKEENEQLRKENIFLAKQRTYWKRKRDMAVETFEIDEATAKKIRELEKQNEQLQTELNNYEKISNLLTDDADHYDRWIQQIKKYVGKTNEDFEYNEEFIIKFCLSYTLQSLRNNENLKRFQWGMVNDE